MSTSGSGILSWTSPRTATLTIAILGIFIHLNTYSWLGSLSSTLPDVPDRNFASRPPGSAPFAPLADIFANSAATGDRLLDTTAAAAEADGTANKHIYLPEWVAEAKAYLKAQGLSYVPTQSNAGADASANKNSAAGSGKANNAVAYGRYSDTSGGPPAGYEILDDGAEDAERAQWDALRLVIGTLRWYILFSVACCCAGVVGVLRSQLLLSRLFVIHSFLDFLLSTLSLFALAIVCTYPNVRAHLCDEFGSGELQGWFSSSQSTGTASGALGNTAHSDVNNLAQSAGTTLSSGSFDVTATASGWETLLDGVFAAENCEEGFRTTVVPLLMVFGLFFAAVRLHCFFLVQRFYATLLRSKVYHYGYATTMSEESGTSTPMSQLAGDAPRERRWKESKLLD
ncbi:expressed protein [Pseudozyma hubeiensis SY62]|uniref:Expressed protein n=1 Tax=Pseudozyma hubeiensis (strain SY62) TaxID=1305764 RepID=R9PMP7_PSEHS|nr:expressed protein [Pseudozyma hubeiensis SY62]GAC99360.1 expressed protein [Pseudozyma hubeiensis SY62]